MGCPHRRSSGVFVSVSWLASLTVPHHDLDLVFVDDHPRIVASQPDPTDAILVEQIEVSGNGSEKVLGRVLLEPTRVTGCSPLSKMLGSPTRVLETNVHEDEMMHAHGCRNKNRTTVRCAAGSLTLAGT